jgi:hypothetical protein
MLGMPAACLCVGLVELRGIEPLTSAVRLHELERFFAVLRRFGVAKYFF